MSRAMWRAHAVVRRTCRSTQPSACSAAWGSPAALPEAMRQGKPIENSYLSCGAVPVDPCRHNRAEELRMPLFLIERAFAELVPTDPATQAVVKQVNDEIGIQWLFSFLSADKRKTYCLYEAPSAEAIRIAARRLNIPADVIIPVSQVRPELFAASQLSE